MEGYGRRLCHRDVRKIITDVGCDDDYYDDSANDEGDDGGCDENADSFSRIIAQTPSRFTGIAKEFVDDWR